MARTPPPGIETDGDRREEIPDVEKPARSRKHEQLEQQIAGIYIMLGGAMTVVPSQMAGERLKLIGRSLYVYSDDIAEAWVDLCIEDKRVQRAWESLTGFSAWSKVVGVHLRAIGDETPAVQGHRQQQQPQPQQPSGDDLAAVSMLADFFREQQSAMRAEPPPQQPNGPQGPSEEAVRRVMEEAARRQQMPRRQQQQQPMPAPPQDAPPMPQTRGRNVGMPSPADLGVSIQDQPEDFPSSGPENVRG